MQKNSLIMMIIFSVILCGCFTSEGNEEGESDKNPLDNNQNNQQSEVFHKYFNYSGYVLEDKEHVNTIDIPQNFEVNLFKAKVTWEDEEDIQKQIAYNNEPDCFQLIIQGPSGTESDSGPNAEEKQGELSVNYPFQYEENNVIQGPETMFIKVQLQYTGDFDSDKRGVPDIEDEGNDFNVTVYYEYRQKIN